MADIAKRRMARYNYGKWVVRHRKAIIVIALLSLIPCTFAYSQLKCNYDLLSYLPDSIQTVQGQDILKDEFGKGGVQLRHHGRALGSAEFRSEGEDREGRPRGHRALAQRAHG